MRVFIEGVGVYEEPRAELATSMPPAPPPFNRTQWISSNGKFFVIFLKKKG